MFSVVGLYYNKYVENNFTDTDISEKF